MLFWIVAVYQVGTLKILKIWWPWPWIKTNFLKNFNLIIIVPRMSWTSWDHLSVRLNIYMFLTSSKHLNRYHWWVMFSDKGWNPFRSASLARSPLVRYVYYACSSFYVFFCFTNNNKLKYRPPPSLYQKLVFGKWKLK